MTIQTLGNNVVNQNRSFELGTATPGSPVTGMIRYNSSLVQFEVYNGTAWVAIITPQPSTPPAWTWGSGLDGRLGDDTTSNRSSPVSVVGGFTDWVQIFAGQLHTAAIRAGQAWCWGGNLNGQLGTGNTSSRSSPVSVLGGFTDWVQISAGSAHTAGIRANGQAWVWGSGTNGRLGTGNTSTRSSPVSVVGGFTDWVQISAGQLHTAAIRANGQAWCWGSGGSGRLGDGTTIVRSSPVSVVGGFTDWVQISAANGHTAAIRANGQAWTWGRNDFGQLGTGNTSSRSSPVSVVGGFTNWVQISAAGLQTAAIRANGQAWCWGSGLDGSNGDGATTNRSSPVSVVGGFTDWVQITVGGGSVLAIRANGQAWAWGLNASLQLGDGTTSDRSSPISVLGGFTDWVQITVGDTHTAALRAI